jgi:hypothetical protein
VLQRFAPLHSLLQKYKIFFISFYSLPNEFNRQREEKAITEIDGEKAGIAIERSNFGIN